MPLRRNKDRSKRRCCLPIMEHRLLGQIRLADQLQYFIESLIGFVFEFQLAVLQLGKRQQNIAVLQDELAHLNEFSSDFDAHFGRDLAFDDPRQANNPFLGIRIRVVSSFRR